MATITNPIPAAVDDISAALAKLRRVIAAVHYPGREDSEINRALDALKLLSRKEGIPIAIIGGMAAIKYGYNRYTDDVDVVIARQHLDTIIRVAPNYGIKVLWQDRQGWHKMEFESVRIEIVPEGARPRKDAPTTIPSPLQLGVSQGANYAGLPGWVETKLGSGRLLDQADVVQVLKKADPKVSQQIREHIAGVHAIYLRLFDELAERAELEKQQEAERGGVR